MTDNLQTRTLEAMRPQIMALRRQSIWQDEGRIFLFASATSYGCTLSGNDRILDEQGHALPKGSERYESIVLRAEWQAQVGSPIGREFLNVDS